MAQKGAALAVGVGAALMSHCRSHVLRSFEAPPGASHGGSVASLPAIAIKASSRLSRRSYSILNGESGGGKNGSSGRYNSLARGAAASYMLVDNPRPTEYQTEICNEAVDVKPGVEKSSTKGLIALTTFLIVVPIVHAKYELHKYYSEYGSFYKTGWSLYHYDKRKNTYLS